MPTFDGEPVYTGETLLDLELGAVVVMALYPEKFIVNVPGRGTQTYSYAGIRQGERWRTLFWHRPVFSIPPKNAEVWRLQREVILSVADSLSGLTEITIADEIEDALPSSHAAEAPSAHEQALRAYEARAGS